MRHNPTPAEERMWAILWQQVIPNFPKHIFRRQWVAFGYILDFYCPTLRLGIEVDGYVHDEQKEYDYYRDNNLARHGIEVHRFSNDEVLYHPQETAAKIYQTLQEKSVRTPVSYGSFAKRKSCFIATAAYGTPMAQEINILRRFRDLKMEPNLIGRNLIYLYYNLSPPLARIIARSRSMKAFVRLSLKPIIRLFESSNSA
jgi:very-short-patch-repair endonuclease